MREVEVVLCYGNLDCMGCRGRRVVGADRNHDAVSGFPGRLFPGAAGNRCSTSVALGVASEYERSTCASSRLVHVMRGSRITWSADEYVSTPKTFGARRRVSATSSVGTSRPTQRELEPEGPVAIFPAKIDFYYPIVNADDAELDGDDGIVAVLPREIPIALVISVPAEDVGVEACSRFDQRLAGLRPSLGWHDVLVWDRSAGVGALILGFTNPWQLFEAIEGGFFENALPDRLVGRWEAPGGFLFTISRDAVFMTTPSGRTKWSARTCLQRETG